MPPLCRRHDSHSVNSGDILLSRKRVAADGCPTVSHNEGTPELGFLLFELWSDPSALALSRQQKSMVSPELGIGIFVYGKYLV